MITPADTAELIRSLKENAARLGLTWQRRYGTVQAVSGLVATVVLDGDNAADAKSPATAHINANSLVGPLLPTSRVCVDSVPPDAHYVVGVISNAPYTGMRLLAQAEVNATSDLTLGTSTADVPGCSVTGTLLVAGQFKAYAICDFQYTVAGASRAAGALTVDGVQALGQPVFDAGGGAALLRATVGQNWAGSLAAGSHTIKLRALKSAAAATILARQDNTTLIVEFWVPTL